jgi:hypothetical protein
LSLIKVNISTLKVQNPNLRRAAVKDIQRILDGIAQWLGYGTSEQFIAFRLDDRSGECSMVVPFGETELPYVDVGLAKRRREFRDDMESIVGVDKVVVEGDVDGDSPEEKSQDKRG